MSFYILWLTKIFNVHYSKLRDFLTLISPENAYNYKKNDFKNFNFSYLEYREMDIDRLKRRLFDNIKIVSFYI